MTMFQKKAVQRRAELDAGADKWLEKLRSSKWSGLILLAAAFVIIAALWALF